MSRVGRFWLSATAVALVFPVAVALLLPYESLRLHTQAERWQAWQLTVWTGGVMSVLFGISGLIGFLNPVGLRDVVDAGSVTRAVENARSARRLGGGEFHGNFAWWLVSTGGLLIGAYFASRWLLDV